jgi:hypothetical protein
MVCSDTLSSEQENFSPPQEKISITFSGEHQSFNTMAENLLKPRDYFTYHQI